MDLLNSEWINKSDPPEIDQKLSYYKEYDKYDLIFSVGTIFLLDQNDIDNLIKLILGLKNRKGKIIIFDYKKKN